MGDLMKASDLKLALTLRSLRQQASRRAGAAHVCLLLLALTAAAHADPLAYITAQGADSLSIVDLAQGRVVETLKIGKKPAGVAVAPGGGRIYATNPEGHSFSVIERAENGAHRVIAEIPAGAGPLGIALDPQGKTIFVADWYADEVHIFDADSLKETGAIKVGQSPAGMASDGGRFLYVANRESDTVSVVDIFARQTVATIPVGKAPFGVTYDPEGRRLFVANVQSGDVSVIDPKTRRETRRLKVRSFPYAIALTPDGKIFVTNQHDDSVTVFDGATLEELKTIEACGYPEGILAAGGAVYIACWMDDVLARIDANTLAVAQKIPVAASPRAFGLFVVAPALTPPPAETPQKTPAVR